MGLYYQAMKNDRSNGFLNEIRHESLSQNDFYIEVLLKHGSKGDKSASHVHDIKGYLSELGEVSAAGLVIFIPAVQQANDQNKADEIASKIVHILQLEE